MPSQHSQEVLTGVPLSLSSLRLLVPPLQLMTASMWQVIKQQDVVNYWAVSEFVSLVTEMVPELLLDKHRTQLNLGLRARYILELCHNDHLLEPDVISPYLDTIERLMSTPVNEVEVENVGANFLELVQTLLKNSDEREHFFREVFFVEYGPQYNADLQTLFWEFLCRLAQLLPIPDLEQTVSWLGNSPSVLEECVHSVSEPVDLKTLLLHHKHLGHLEQHVPPLSMGDCILSSLVAFPINQVSESTEKPCGDTLTEPYQPAREPPISFVDEVEVEVVTVTDYAEVELGTTCDVEVAIEGGCLEVTDIDPSPVVPEEAMETPEAPDTAREEVTTVDEGMRGSWCQTGMVAVVHVSEVDSVEVPSPRKPSGSHTCPDCNKSFKFASSLIAHRVIHTGERPHRCAVCGRCFSFRQSLERHKHVHKNTQKFDCVICGEAFTSQSAYMEHERKHRADGAYVCTACGAKFTQDLEFVKHLKTHEDGSAEVDQRERAENPKDEGEVVAIAEKVAEVAVTHGEGIPQGSEVVDDYCDRTSQDVEKQTNHHPPAQPEVVSLVQVRSSGRKRKPTMKIHVLNLQKSIRKGSSPKKRQTEKPPDVKPVPFNSVEHSYGSPVLSSKDGDDEPHVLQHITTVHPGEAEDNSSPFLPPVDSPEGQFNCPDCDKTFKFKSLMKVHRRVHTGERPYLCSQCGRSFSFKQSMERHKRTHKEGRQYECQICGELFKSAAAQKDHRITHMENGEYLCSKCGRAFAWKSALVRHLRTHGDGAEKTEHAHKCSHCDLTFSCVTYLNRHLLTHKGERLHACVCGKSFAYRAALTAHQRIHQKERPHQCKQCGKGFLYKGGLQSHMKIHSEDMPYMCSFCGKSFKRERNMKKHERCHTGENVFSCSQCDKSFVYKATLIRHELTHSGERPFLCSDCGKGFFSHAELLKHERFHTGHKPFQCPHCGKKFTQSCYLTIHLRYHTGVRPYTCPECDKSFLSANRLKRHQRTHTGEKPYTCGECGKGFKQSYHLKVHQRTHKT